MGILDDLNKTIGTVNKTTGTVRSGMDAAKSAKETAGAVGKVFEQKCKYCKQPLKMEEEKKKGICARCALASI
ncbi:MAG: hypothetical protein PHD95_05885 [Candidatus ainarchaeum sp.]|nr:hypothetical protein [Candidatus ainarchaeum sp.]